MNLLNLIKDKTFYSRTLIAWFFVWIFLVEKQLAEFLPKILELHLNDIFFFLWIYYRIFLYSEKLCLLLRSFDTLIFF